MQACYRNDKLQQWLHTKDPSFPCMQESHVTVNVKMSVILIEYTAQVSLSYKACEKTAPISFCCIVLKYLA